MTGYCWHAARRIGHGWLLIVALAALLTGAGVANAGTLDEVRQRGSLNCGVSEGLAGFSLKGDDKRWSGFDVDFCRALAAAIFGDGDKVTFVALSATDRFEALKTAKIDVLSRNTTWTMEREVLHGFEFLGISYYDGQGFLTRRSNGLSSALQLAPQASVCVLAGTTSEENVRRFFEHHKIPVTVKSFESRDEVVKAYDGDTCTFYSADSSALASDRLRMSEPDDHMLLPEVISKEPLGPLVRRGDAQWADLGRWVLYLLINAEEAGWTKAAAGGDGTAGAITVSKAVSDKLGLDEGWPRAVIQAVGNYGEIFERNVGANSPLDLSRGVNALWTHGGILYAPPMR